MRTRHPARTINAMHATDTARRLENLLRYGTVEALDCAKARLRVRSGGLLTAWLPWLAPRAGTTSVWSAPSVGEQVLVLSPGGDPACGVVLPAIYSTANPPPSDKPQTVLVTMPDGAVIAYDGDQHQLLATLPSGGSASITAPGGVSITGDVTIKGDVSVDGKVDATGDVKAGDISLQNHKHSGVQSGSAITGAPQ